MSKCHLTNSKRMILADCEQLFERKMIETSSKRLEGERIRFQTDIINLEVILCCVCQNKYWRREGSNWPPHSSSPTHMTAHVLHHKYLLGLNYQVIQRNTIKMCSKTIIHFSKLSREKE
ncbi:hypothetical protein CEXT_198211 [Caerostris extrusa]|uniref:Uncharacterized protein n=1 Tax=Caerostris extrusa TaxID=172846 RepID=A0AAV4V8R9_CAEEX|nr:hypothetical protein CEXT_198211 [Caerostris extrusa]